MPERENAIVFMFQKPQLPIVVVATVLVVASIGIADYLTGYEISFSLFYLLPISLAIIFGNFNLGIVISVVSAIIWFSVDFLSGHEYSNTFIPIWNALMRLGYFTLHSLLLSKMIANYEQQKSISNRDQLTGVYNWRFFSEILERELNKAKKSASSLCLCYMDMDNFKYVNDNLGHDVGNQVLIRFSSTVTGNLNGRDVFARIGGDEFVLLITNKSYDETVRLVSHLFDVSQKELKTISEKLSLSFGGAFIKDADISSKDLLKKSDEIMYKIKKGGKSNFEIVTV
ncbi:GGDEF domain-containing protein [bacterium]|nr:GGDEF domain-containing protein [bacterium]